MLLLDYKVMVLCQSEPIDSQNCGWTGPSGSYYDCKTSWAITIMKPWTKKIYYLQDLEITWHT